MLPYALAFAAGAMIYVVVEEVIPETQRDKYTDVATLGFILGFVLMMVLDEENMDLNGHGTYLKLLYGLNTL